VAGDLLYHAILPPRATIRRVWRGAISPTVNMSSIEKRARTRGGSFELMAKAVLIVV
jgi:hypothetical protein